MGNEQCIMKQNRFASLTLLLAGLFLVSCASQSPLSSSRPRFREADAASVVLHYSGWERINVTRPEYRQDNFLVQLSPKEIGLAFARLGVKRDMAVVVLDWDHGQQNLNEIVSDWKTILFNHGFKRVVCLEVGRHNQVQGLQVIDDTQSSDATLLRTVSR